MMDYKLGKKPARKNSVILKFADYLDVSKFPKIPNHFGHEGFQDTFNWGVLGNDTVGDCVIAGAMHETMIWSRVGQGKIAQFSKESAIKTYSEITGYSPDNANSDQGTDMAVAASYRKNTGVLGSDGIRHKVAGYLALNPGNLQQHLIAMYLFGAVGIGILFPNSAMQQFNQGRVWDIDNSSSIEGGHYVPLVANRSHILCVTWGRLQGMTNEFFQRYNDESIVYLSEEMLKNRKSAEGFDYDQLTVDLVNLNPGKTIS